MGSSSCRVRSNQETYEINLPQKQEIEKYGVNTQKEEFILVMNEFRRSRISNHQVTKKPENQSYQVVPPLESEYHESSEDVLPGTFLDKSKKTRSQTFQRNRTFSKDMQRNLNEHLQRRIQHQISKKKQYSKRYEVDYEGRSAQDLEEIENQVTNRKFEIDF